MNTCDLGLIDHIYCLQQCNYWNILFYSQKCSSWTINYTVTLLMSFQILVSCSSHQEGFSYSKPNISAKNSSASRGAGENFTSREKQTQKHWNFWKVYTNAIFQFLWNYLLSLRSRKFCILYNIYVFETVEK